MQIPNSIRWCRNVGVGLSLDSPRARVTIASVRVGASRFPVSGELNTALPLVSFDAASRRSNGLLGNPWQPSIITTCVGHLVSKQRNNCFRMASLLGPGKIGKKLFENRLFAGSLTDYYR